MDVCNQSRFRITIRNKRWRLNYIKGILFSRSTLTTLKNNASFVILMESLQRAISMMNQLLTCCTLRIILYKIHKLKLR